MRTLSSDKSCYRKRLIHETYLNGQTGPDIIEVSVLSPRNTRYQTPEYVADAIRSKRKKLLYGPHSCPKCGMEKLRIEVDKKNKQVIVVCGCGLERQLNYVPAFEGVDYYNRFADNFKKQK
jgi:transcription elongation factor Elf1